jgi:hypothetical protein
MHKMPQDILLLYKRFNDPNGQQEYDYWKNSWGADRDAGCVEQSSIIKSTIAGAANRSQ